MQVNSFNQNPYFSRQNQFGFGISAGRVRRFAPKIIKRLQQRKEMLSAESLYVLSAKPSSTNIKRVGNRITEIIQDKKIINTRIQRIQRFMDKKLPLRRAMKLIKQKFGLNKTD